jgi:hypothetical protein
VCEWDTQINFEGVCSDKAECGDYFYYQLETNSCQKDECPEYFYVGISGKDCEQVTCGNRAKVDVSGKECYCESPLIMTVSGNCVEVPSYIDSVG